MAIDLIRPLSVRMLSRLSFQIMLLVVITPLTAVMGHRQSLPERISQLPRQTPPEVLPDASVPVCYIQLENGQLRDLRRFCGKKSLTPSPFRSGPRSSTQPEADDDNDELTPVSESGAQTVPLPRSPNGITLPQAIPTSPTPQPSAGSLQGIPDRSTNGQPSPGVPSNTPLASPSPSASPNPPTFPSAFPHPLAIPKEEKRDD